MRRTIMNLIWILTIAGISYCGLMVFAWLFSGKMIFPVPTPQYTEDTFPLLRLPIDDNTEIAALYLPNEAAHYTLLYCHGNAEDLGSAKPLLEAFHKRGYAVFAFDYPGYGLSDGKPSEAGCFAAIAAAFHYLKIFHNCAAEQMILYGRSLGSGSAIYLASREPVAGLILDGAFSSTFRVVTRYQILPWDVFDNLARIDQVKCPILSIHGKRDRTVPFSHAVKLYEAARGQRFKLWVDAAGHNNLIEISGEDYWQAIDKFVESFNSDKTEKPRS